MSMMPSSLLPDLSIEEQELLSGGVNVRTEGLLSRGINRISVDLGRFIKPEFENQTGLSVPCRGDYRAGRLNVNCDVRKYVIGEGLSPFSR